MANLDFKMESKNLDITTRTSFSVCVQPRPIDYESDHNHLGSNFKNSEDDEIPWCLTCFHAQPNEPGVGCTYLEYDHSNDQYRGLGDYPCGDLDVITIDPEEKQECFVNFIEPEDCSRYSLCLIRNGSDSAAHSANLLMLTIFVLLMQFLNQRMHVNLVEIIQTNNKILIIKNTNGYCYR